jgi:hypothetical protein
MRVLFERLAVAACVLLLPMAAQAQEVASSLDQLRVLVRPGDNLTVTDAAGAELRGKVFELSSTSLVIQTRGQRHEFLGDDIRRITQPRHADLGTGARWGFGVGASFGVLMMATMYGECRGCAAWAIANTVAVGGVGAAVGVGIAASITDQRLIYARPGLPVKVAVAPFIDRERQGLRVSVGF